METYSPSEQQSAEASKTAHLGLITERINNIAQLQGLLELSDKDEVLRRLGTVTFSGKPFGLPEGFNERDISAIQGNIQELIELLEAENNKVKGLVVAIKSGLVGVTRPKSSDVLNTELTPAQAEYVREAVEAGYERFKTVNEPLIDKKGVPDFPSKEAALKAALSQLTPAKVDYMMEEDRVPFRFKIKLVYPKDRFDLTRALLDGQPKKMDTRAQKQQNLRVWDRAERYLTEKDTGNGSIEWKWSFYQDEQVIDEVEEWDDTELTLETRLSKFKAQLPEGMKGTDLFDLTTSMADGLEAGKPMDIRFEGDSTDTESYEKWNFTVADEEGELTEGGIRCLVGGRFDPYCRSALLYGYRADDRVDDARLRAAVDGSIES